MKYDRRWMKRVRASYEDPLDEVILTVANKSYTKNEVVSRLNCGHWGGARILDRAIREFNRAHRIRPRTVREQARKMTADDLLAMPRANTTAWIVFMNVLGYHGLDPEAWDNRGQVKLLKVETRAHHAKHPRPKRNNVVKFHDHPRRNGTTG